MIKCRMQYIFTLNCPNVWSLFLIEEDILSHAQKRLASQHAVSSVENWCFSTQRSYFIICASKFKFAAETRVNVKDLKSKANYKHRSIIMRRGCVCLWVFSFVVATLVLRGNGVVTAETVHWEADQEWMELWDLQWRSFPPLFKS